MTGRSYFVFMKALYNQATQQSGITLCKNKNEQQHTLICTSNIAFVLTFSPSVVSTCCARRSLLRCLIFAQ